MSSRIQVGALPIRLRPDGRKEILLITARGKARWLIPKGGRCERLSDYKAAAREAFEEGGVTGKTNTRPLGEYTHLKADGRKGPRIIDFKLEVKRHHESWREEDDRKRMWVKPEKAARMIREAPLRKLILSV